MHRFFFNDCLPENTNKAEFIIHLTQTVKEFDILLRKEIGVERGVITQNLPSQIQFQNGYSLLDVIESITDMDTKTFAFSILGKHYPINNFFDDSNEKLLDHLYDYKLDVNGNPMDALNLATVYFNNGFVFTPALHDDVAKNPLLITKVSEPVEYFSLNNLFGIESNTKIIHDEIVKRNTDSMGIYDQLLECLGNRRISKQFPRDFKALTITDQKNIVKHFQDARNRDGRTPFFADGDLIKDVTPDKSKSDVFELRIFNPRALRIYFCEKDQVVYLASIGFKAAGDQDTDIRTAKNAIDKLIIIG